ncbi:NADH dehydrogenase subunit H [Yoonia tamlensis]|uniref:NADH-quinone oxidoreductase subunit H n=1 Tax=Yoonia tamlensis TaxID=390270 RepID=A0A1I6GJE5_9RHOB|nr:NADH dehydrogenase subunit H [Yoonia tamlensis]
MVEFFTNTNLGIVLVILAQCLLVLVPLLVALAFLMYADRKIWAAVQMRKGPNIVGAFGLLQSFADFLKYIVKEIVVPAGADKFVFFLAPMISFVLAVVAWSVIPFNDGWVLSNINVAILFVFAVSSLEVYGVIMGGWASNSKYPFLGSLRSAAQMISYEVSLGLIIIGVIISTGSMNFGDIVAAQDGKAGLFNWYWVAHFPMLFLFFISALAETNRPPFDLPEAESELVAGYQVEYSSTPFLLFMIGELMAVVLMCALISLLFFGGWLSPIPGLPDGILWMVLKMSACFFVFSMVKAITPRYRYDQLMRIGWKVFLPMSLIWVVLISFLAKFEVAGGFWARWDDEPATIAEFMDQNCSAEFAALREISPSHDLVAMTAKNGINPEVSLEDAAKVMVFATHISSFLPIAVPSPDGAKLIASPDADPADIALLAAISNTSECLGRETGFDIAGSELPSEGGVSFTQIRTWTKEIISTEGSEG